MYDTMRILPLECDGVFYYDHGTPEYGQICVAHTGKGTYIKGTYGGYLPYCKKYKILNGVEYTCPNLKMVKMDIHVPSVVWVKNDVIRTTKN